MPFAQFSLAIFAAAVPLIVSAAPIDFTSSSNSISFNGSSPGTLTLGNDTCPTLSAAACTLTATATGTSDGTVSLSLGMPNLETSPFSYSGDPSLITTSGSPILSVSLSDLNGDSAQGTFALTNLLPDGVTEAAGFMGVDIDGSITISSITAGANLASFDSLFGLASSTPLTFTLDVGHCVSGSKAKACIQSTDPMASFIFFDLEPGLVSSVPEPGSFELLGCASGALLVGLRWWRAPKA
jgi:hypothetical protein